MDKIAAPPGFRFGGDTLAVGLIGNAGEFLKIFKIIRKKIAKMHYFSIFFNKF